MKKAPDSSKFVLNPGWQGSEEQQDEAYRMCFTLDDYHALCPELIKARVPEQGAWIMVKQPPCTEFTVPAMSVWYALPDDKPTSVIGQTYHRVKILTPKGSLWLWPNEYVIVDDVSKYFEYPEDHIRIHYLGGEGVNRDKLFYLRTRGISKKQALQMLIGEVRTQDVIFVTIHPVYADCFCRQLPPEDRLCIKEEWPEVATV